MASLHVRNIEDEVIDLLKARATRNGRSSEAEHREILKAALVWEQAPKTDADDWKRRAAAFRKSLDGQHLTPSGILLRESRDER